MTKQIKIIVSILYSDSVGLSACVKSIMDSIIKPTEIIIADYGIAIPDSLKKKQNIKIVPSKNYGVLSSLAVALNKYKDHKDVYILKHVISLF
jgi:hypothetical protein